MDGGNGQMNERMGTRESKGEAGAHALPATILSILWLRPQFKDYEY